MLTSVLDVNVSRLCGMVFIRRRRKKELNKKKKNRRKKGKENANINYIRTYVAKSAALASNTYVDVHAIYDETETETFYNSLATSRRAATRIGKQ